MRKRYRRARRPLSRFSGPRRVQLQNPAPAAFRVEYDPHRLRRITQSFELTMFDLDACQRRTEHNEPDFDFGPDALVMLPIAADLPREDQSAWRVPHQYLAPQALRSVGSALEPAAPDARFDDRGFGVLLGNVMGGERPPCAMLLGEHAKGTGLARL